MLVCSYICMFASVYIYTHQYVCSSRTYVYTLRDTHIYIFVLNSLKCNALIRHNIPHYTLPHPCIYTCRVMHNCATYIY